MAFQLNAIVAVSDNGVIGKDNDLIWKLRTDLQYFKKVTSGHCIISGRKNYESIGRPLPGRTNIILTRDTSYHAEGCIVLHDLDSAIQYAKDIGDESPFIIGGGQIYRAALPYISTFYVTEVHDEFEGDTFFDSLTEGWEEVSRQKGEKSDKDECEFTFVVYHNTQLKL